MVNSKFQKTIRAAAAEESPNLDGSDARIVFMV